MVDLWLSAAAKIFGIIAVIFCFAAIWLQVIKQVIYVEKQKRNDKHEK